MDEIEYLPNGQWELKKMSKWLKPKRSQGFLIPKNENIWDMPFSGRQEKIRSAQEISHAKRQKAKLPEGHPDRASYDKGIANMEASAGIVERAPAGRYNHRTDNTTVDPEILGLQQDIHGTDYDQNTRHHEHQHRIISHVANKMKMYDHKGEITHGKHKADMLSHHLIRAAGITPKELNSLDFGATGKVGGSANEIISNIIGWMNMGRDNREDHLKSHPAYPAIPKAMKDELHNHIDGHMRSMHSKLQNAMNDLHPSHEIHVDYKNNDIKHHKPEES